MKLLFTCNVMNCSMSGSFVIHCLLHFALTHLHCLCFGLVFCLFFCFGLIFGGLGGPVLIFSHENTKFATSCWQWTEGCSVQFSSVAQSCPTLCHPMNCSTPGLLAHHQLPEFIQIHIQWVGYANQPSHPLSSPFPPAPNPSQHQSLFQWVNSSHEVAKVLEFQL